MKPVNHSRPLAQQTANPRPNPKSSFLSETGEAAELGTCRLCGEQDMLCRSHIIPEFCHSACYEGPKHQATLVHFTDDHKSVKPTKVQVGRRELLFCGNCEGIVSRYEQWFHGYWYGPSGLPQQVHTKSLVLDCPNVEMFRLFHLSVLLRASLSRRYLREVSLGDHYEAVLGKSILTGKAPPHSHFPIIGSVLVDDKGFVMHNLIAGATRNILHESRTRAYGMTYAGCEWLFVVTDHPSAKDARFAQAVSLAGKVTLLVTRHVQSMTRRNIIAQLQKAKAAGRME
jgi:hypothetical protein